MEMNLACRNEVAVVAVTGSGDCATWSVVAVVAGTGATAAAAVV